MSSKAWVIHIIQSPAIPLGDIFNQSDFSLNPHVLSNFMGMKESFSWAAVMKRQEWDGAVDSCPTQPQEVSKKLNLTSCLCSWPLCARIVWLFVLQKSRKKQNRKTNKQTKALNPSSRKQNLPHLKTLCIYWNNCLPSSRWCDHLWCSYSWLAYSWNLNLFVCKMVLLMIRVLIVLWGTNDHSASGTLHTASSQCYWFVLASHRC